MPTYAYECRCGAAFERVLPLSEYDRPQSCKCGKTAEKVVCAPNLMIPQDIHYQSPIDGRPITSMRARADDLARSDCTPYDPGQRQDYDRRNREAEIALEKAVDETVEQHVSALPSEKREQLQTELTHMTAEPVRQTASNASIKKAIQHGR